MTLNRKSIIENQPFLGPTGGALWPKVDRLGPIYLQGDHTDIEYHNLVIRPVLKNPRRKPVAVLSLAGR